MLRGKELFLMPCQNCPTYSFTITKKQQMQGAWGSIRMSACQPSADDGCVENYRASPEGLF